MTEIADLSPTTAPTPIGRRPVRVRHIDIGMRIGLVMLALHVAAATAGPWLAPYGAGQLGTGIPLSGMSWRHLFGVDQLGRDVFSRVLFGAHVIILLSAIGTVVGLALGAVIGLFSAYAGGWIDEVIQRMVEAFISIPFLILGLLAVYAAGPAWSGSPALMATVIAVIYTPRIARMARASALNVITQDYVMAAQLRGERPWSVIWHELMPNTLTTLLVEFALRAAYAPALIASLGFLGFGIRPPTPEWGTLISENRSFLLLSPAIVLAPGLCLASLVVAINFVAEGASRMVGGKAELSGL